jgi:rhodanese-related sulfurtransferase
MNIYWTMTGLAVVLSLGAACSTTTTAPAATAATTPPAATATATASTEAELRPMTVDELAGMIDRREQVAVIDNNGQESYARGHIPGARWVGHDAVTASVLPADRAARVVFYCHNEQCTACHTAARQAIALGYTNVFILPAGIVGWQGAGKPVVAGTNPT